jgi:hypothetical protein
MADETQSSIRITNLQVYEKLMELNSVQIEMLVDLRNMKAIPEKVSAIERELARLKVIAGMSYAVFAAVLTGVTAALIRML